MAIPTGVNYRWLAASVNPVPSNGAAVGTVPGEGADTTGLTQTDPALRPLYRPTGIGGKPALEFDGTDELVTAAAISRAQAATWVVVLRPAAGTLRGQVLHHQREIFWHSSAYGIYHDTGVSPAGDPVRGADQVWTGVFNGGSSRFLVNGTQAATGTTTSSTATNVLAYIGGRPDTAPNFPGMIAEVLCWNKALTTQELADVHTYVQDTYGITVSDYNGTNGPTAKPVYLKWTPVSGSSAQSIERSEDTGITWTALTSPTATDKQYTDTTSVTGKTYLYRIKYVKDGLTADWSNVASVTT